MTARLTWHPAGGCIVAMTGAVEIGTVTPYADGSARWCLWAGRLYPVEGHGKTILGAKAALMSAWADWLRRARLTSEAEVVEIGQ